MSFENAPTQIAAIGMSLGRAATISPLADAASSAPAIPSLAQTHSTPSLRYVSPGDDGSASLFALPFAHGTRLAGGGAASPFMSPANPSMQVLDAAMKRYSDAQVFASSINFETTLVETALSSFKRLTQGQ